jgi:hypothetical protein
MLMEATPARSTRSKRAPAPAVSPMLVVGAVVEVLCENSEWQAGKIIRREPAFTAAERRQGAPQARVGGELRQLGTQEALTVVAVDRHDGMETVLKWQPPPGESRTNAAIPQALWGTRVKVLYQAPGAACSKTGGLCRAGSGRGKRGCELWTRPPSHRRA